MKKFMIVDGRLYNQIDTLDCGTEVFLNIAMGDMIYANAADIWSNAHDIYQWEQKYLRYRG